MFLEGSGICKDTCVNTVRGIQRAEKLPRIASLFNPESGTGRYTEFFRWSTIGSVEIITDLDYKIVAGPDQIFVTEEGCIPARYIDESMMVYTAKGLSNVVKVRILTVMLDVFLVINNKAVFEAAGLELKGEDSVTVDV